MLDITVATLHKIQPCRVCCQAYCIRFVYIHEK